MTIVEEYSGSGATGSGGSEVIAHEIGKVFIEFTGATVVREKRITGSGGFLTLGGGMHANSGACAAETLDQVGDPDRPPRLSRRIFYFEMPARERDQKSGKRIRSSALRR